MLSTFNLPAIAWVSLGLVVVAFGSGWWFRGAIAERDALAIERSLNEAVKIATAKTMALEKAHNDVLRMAEVNHAQQSQKIEATLAENRRLVRELGGLRDPGKSRGGPVSRATTTSPKSVDPPTATRLSDESAEFLLEQSAVADRVAVYAGTCYDWITRTSSSR